MFIMLSDLVLLSDDPEDNHDTGLTVRLMPDSMTEPILSRSRESKFHCQQHLIVYIFVVITTFLIEIQCVFILSSLQGQASNTH